MATLGWESVEAHLRFREMGVFKEAFAELKGHRAMEMYHLKF
jgi:hypothetical protein